MSDPATYRSGTPRIQPPAVARWHSHLHGLATTIHEISGLAKLEHFGIEDPNPETNNLPDSIGVFTGADYGSYFTEKFAALTGMGASGELEALMVGAFIEELDMYDIVECPEVIVEANNGIGEGECGLNYTDQRALQLSLTNLLAGSENHLCAFVGQIEAITGEPYVAQYLSQTEVDEILGRCQN